MLNFTASASAGTVQFEITGTNVDKFTYSDQTASTVKVSAVGNNESDAAYTAVLTLKSEAGDVLASVNLKQVSANVASYTMITKVADIKAGKGYLAGLVSNQYQTWTGEMESKHCKTTPYTYDAESGSFTPVSGEAAEIELVAVDGVAGAYYIKCGNQYLTVSEAGKSCLALSDTAENNYWTFEDAVDGVKGIANAYASWLLTSASASSNHIRSYSTTSTTKTGVIFFLEK